MKLENKILQFPKERMATPIDGFQLRNQYFKMLYQKSQDKASVGISYWLLCNDMHENEVKRYIR
jgi:hypothetical protein